MKVLVNESFKAMRVGEFVKAAKDAGEFILDTTNCDYAVATLKEIAEENNLKIKGKTKAEILASLEAALPSLKLPEQNKMGQTEQIQKIVDDGVAAGHDDDTMLITIFSAKLEGVKFSMLNKLFNAAMEAGGHRVALKKVKEEGRSMLVEAEFDPENYEQVTEMAANIVRAVDGADTVQAIKAIKAYCKEFDFEMPKAPKVPKGTLLERVYGWIKKNPTAETADLAEWLEDQKKGEKIIARYVSLMQFAQDFAAIANAAPEEAEEEEAA